MNLYIFQKDEIAPDMWKDAFGTANIVPADKTGNLGNWVDVVRHPNLYTFYDRTESKLVMFSDPDDPKLIVIRHPNDFTNSAVMSFRITDIKNFMSKIHFQDKIMVYACEIMSDNSTHAEIAQTAAFFGRPDGGQIMNLVTNKPLENHTKLVPWFFVLKGKEDFYYIVPNISQITVSNTVARGTDTEDVIITADNHLGSFNNFIFRPTFSRNTRVINDTNLMVMGDSLTIKPFDTLLCNGVAKGFFKVKDIKCSTNYEYKRDENGLYFHIDKPNGYIILRYNTVTSMDFRFRSSNRIRKEYTVTKIGK